MLLTLKQWNKAVSELTRTCDKRLIKSIQTKHQRVERHFDTDYSNAQGVHELGSKPVASWVVLDIFQDPAKLGHYDNKIPIADVLEVTPLVELENGETLSDVEATEGLGSFLPSLVEPAKAKVRDGWKDRVPGARIGIANNTRTSGKVCSSAGEGGVSDRAGQPFSRRSPYQTCCTNAKGCRVDCQPEDSGLGED